MSRYEARSGLLVPSRRIETLEDIIREHKTKEYLRKVRKRSDPRANMPGQGGRPGYTGAVAPTGIQYITTAAAASSSLTASGGASGDIMIGVAYGGTTTPSNASGWTSIDNDDGGAASIRVSWRTYDESSHSWTNATNVSYHVYRGVHATVPIGQKAKSIVNSASTWTCPGITVTGSPNAWVFWCVSVANDNTGAPGIPTLPATNQSRHSFTGVVSGRAGDTGQAVSSFSATTGSMPSNQDTAAVVFELLMA